MTVTALIRKVYASDSKLLKQGAGSAVLRAAALGGRFVLVGMLGFFLPVEQVGAFGLVTGAVTIAQAFLDLSFREYTTREIVGARTSGFQARRIRDQMVVHLLTYVVAAPVIWWALSTGVLPKEHALWFLPILLIDHLHNESKRFLVVFRRPLLANTSLLIGRAAWAAPLAIIWLVAPQTRTLESVWIAWMLGNLGSLSLSWWALRDLDWRRAIRVRPDWGWMRRGVIISLPFLLSGLLVTLNRNLDRFILNHFTELSAVGAYNFFSTVANGVYAISITGQGMILMPIAARHWARGEWKAFSRTQRQMVISSFVATIGLALMTGLIIHFMLPFLRSSEVYRQYEAAMWVLMLGLVLSALANGVRLGLYVRRMDKGLLSSAIAGFVVTIGADFLLIPQYGPVGAAWAQVLGILALLVTRTVVWFLHGRDYPPEPPGRGGDTRSLAEDF